MLRTPIATMDATTLHWLAGLLEGEGTFIAGPPSSPNRPVVQVHMTDEDVIARVASLFGVPYYSVSRSSAKPHWKPAWIVAARGARARVLMAMLQPLMGIRRRAQIGTALASYTPHSFKKLDAQMAAQIRCELRDGVTPKEIVARYNISRSMVQSLKANEVWLGHGPDLSSTIKIYNREVHGKRRSVRGHYATQTLDSGK